MVGIRCLSELLVLIKVLLLVVDRVSGIDCFKCVSINGNNPSCEDPFHNNYSATILESPCWAGRKGRDGVFPATACVKLNGIFNNDGKSMVVRDCALDSGTLTTDTELVRMSHCGSFYFDGKYVAGCVQSCFEDACNGAPPKTPGIGVTLRLTAGTFGTLGVSSSLSLTLLVITIHQLLV